MFADLIVALFLQLVVSNRYKNIRHSKLYFYPQTPTNPLSWLNEWQCIISRIIQFLMFVNRFHFFPKKPKSIPHYSQLSTDFLISDYSSKIQPAGPKVVYYLYTMYYFHQTHITPSQKAYVHQILRCLPS